MRLKCGVTKITVLCNKIQYRATRIFGEVNSLIVLVRMLPVTRRRLRMAKYWIRLVYMDYEEYREVFSTGKCSYMYNKRNWSTDMK